MKYLQTYNESIRDKMVSKSKENILKDIKDINKTMMDQMGYDDDSLYFHTNIENIDNVKFLLENGADPSYNEYAILRYACTIGDEKFVRKLFDDYNVPVNASDGIALRTSAEFHHPLLLIYIIHEGGDVKKYGEEAMQYTIDTALNNEEPIISDCLLILLKNGMTSEHAHNIFEMFMDDDVTEDLIKELEEKLK